jgi:NADPH-dependent curcumin reductase CurA
VSVTAGKRVLLAARPVGEPKESDFRIEEMPVPTAAPGQMLLRTLWLSLDPYMRGRMSDAPSYATPVAIGQVMEGRTVSEVVASNLDGFAAGDIVFSPNGWQTHAVSDGKLVRKIDPALAPVSTALGVLGMPGMTAYVGLLDIGQPQEGETVFVSGAAGAVGSLAGQLAKLRGHTVIGSAGSAEKVALVREELGFDAAFDYHDGRVRDLLRAAAPDGIDVYFDNVGGEHLEAAISALHVHGRVALCGAISTYNATAPSPAPRNLAQAIGKRLTLRGFIIFDHEDRRAAFLDEVAPLLRDGRIVARETIVEGGIEAAPQAFMDMLRGANMGKMLVRLAG